MADILLTHSYFLRFDPKQWKTGQPYPPLATLYAASVLREAGYDTAFSDVMFAASSSEILPALAQHKPKLLVICEDGFNYLTKMCLTNMRQACFEMIAMAKQQGCRVIISGSDATDHIEKYLDAGADYIIIGEVERTLVELTNSLLKNDITVASVPGLVYREEGRIIRTVARGNLRDLDNIPFPAWDLVDMDKYRNTWLASSGYFSLNTGTTRGCPFKCNWCAKPIYGNRYNSRSPENVVAELKMLKERYHFDHIWFCDDIFGLKPGWTKHFADLVQKEGLEFSFKIQSRVDLLLGEDQPGKKEDNIEALARAGCAEVWVGAESGSQKILDAMDKGTTVQQIIQATRAMSAKGIKPCFFLQFGYPGEQKEDIKATLDMVFELMPHDIGISVSYPLPGTKFYENVKAELSEKTNWTDSDELLVMFRSTYPPEFYKKLQRYVHKEFRKRQAFASFSKLLKKPGSIHLPDLKKAVSLTWRIPQSALAKAELSKYVS